MSTLPQTIPAEMTNGHSQEEVQASNGVDSSLFLTSQVRVLVLDDDPAICRLVELALAKQGLEVTSVSNPNEMLPTIEKNEFQLVIMDWCIPGLDANDILQLLSKKQPDTSVVVVTAYPSVDSALNCLRAHIEDYILKPFEIQKLTETVSRCLKAKGYLRLSEEALRESLGSVIRDRRRERALTLAEMAKRTNVSLGYLSQIELGKNSASIETLYRISLGLGMRMADLFSEIQS